MENKKRKDGKTSSRILTSVLVCFVLIAIYGIVTQLKVSYAFPDVLAEIKNVKEIYPEQPKNSSGNYTYNPDNPTAVPSGWYKPGSKIVGNIVLEGKTTATYIIDLFCLQKEKVLPDIENDNHLKEIYRKATDQSKIDEGINYIVLKAYNDNDLSENESNGVKTVHLLDGDYYDAQTALWIYQNNQKADADKDSQMNTIWSSVSSSHSSGHAKKIYEYVTGAQQAYNNRNVQNAITLDGKVEFQPTADGNYYETEDLTVNITKAPNTEFTGFKLTLNNDSNVEISVVDSNNNVIPKNEYDTKIASGQKFKFRIKKDDLPVETTVGITGEIKGNFTHIGFEAYEGYLEGKTTPNTALQIVLVPVTKPTPKSIKIEATVRVPDTGAGYSGYIYIIGALVLIVGLTIIYVNTKVQEN